MTTADDRTLPHEAEREGAVRRDLAALLTTTPIPQPELADNLSLYLYVKTMLNQC